MKQKEKYLSNIFLQLEDFLKKDYPRNGWIENRAIKVYLRKSKRGVSPASDKHFSCLDIGVIEVNQRYTGLGMFNDFVLGAHERNNLEITLINSVLNPIVFQWCMKRGWIPFTPYGFGEVSGFYLTKQNALVDEVVLRKIEINSLARGMEDRLRELEELRKYSINFPDSIKKLMGDNVDIQSLIQKVQALEFCHVGIPG